MPPFPADPDLTASFEAVLRLCRLGPDETLLIFSDPDFPHPAYVGAGLAAARAVGANAYLLYAQPGQGVDDAVIRGAWTHADLILGMSFLPGPYSWMYAPLHSVALAAGARVLMIQEPPDGLLRMLPSAEIARRGLAGARLLQEADEVRFTTAAGTDLTVRKEGRRGAYQSGVADVPGRWDHWPSGMVYCAPHEDSAEGTLVVSPGDVLLTARRRVASEIRLTFRGGRLVDIAGGADAREMAEYLAAAGDDDAYRLAHAGWGTDPRADWGHVGMDSESLYGGITIALGRNEFDSPAPYCGMGGANRSGIHYDICLRRGGAALDGVPVLEEGRFLREDLA